MYTRSVKKEETRGRPGYVPRRRPPPPSRISRGVFFPRAKKVTHIDYRAAHAAKKPTYILHAHTAETLYVLYVIKQTHAAGRRRKIERSRAPARDADYTYIHEFVGARAANFFPSAALFGFIVARHERGVDVQPLGDEAARERAGWI